MGGSPCQGSDVCHNLAILIDKGNKRLMLLVHDTSLGRYPYCDKGALNIGELISLQNDRAG